MTVRTRVVAQFVITRSAAVAAIAALLVSVPAAQTASPGAQTPEKVVPTVDVALLQPLLPAPEGWTKGPVRTNRIATSDDCGGYTYAEAIYTTGDKRIRVTVADSGFDTGSLTVLATMVATLPEGYTGKIQPATTIERVLFQTFPAATRWDADKGEGDFEVLVGKRFVAKAEGTHVDRLETVRGLVEQIDLKKLGALR